MRIEGEILHLLQIKYFVSTYFLDDYCLSFYICRFDYMLGVKGAFSC